MDLYSSNHFLSPEGNTFLTRSRTTFAACTVDLFKMVASSKGYVVGIIDWGRNGHCSRASDVRVAQLICKNLQIVGAEVAVVIQHMVMSRFAGALDTSMATEVPVKLERVAHLGIDHSTGWNVLALTSLISRIFSKESSTMALLNDDKGYLRLVLWMKLEACMLKSL